MSDTKKSIEPTETSVLIVDDSSQYAGVLRKILQGVFGYTDITTVDNPQDAYQLIDKDPTRFGLLFVDYNFPGGENGGDLLQKLCSANLMDSRTAFLITSEPTTENLKNAMAAGALGVVAKPFDRAELKSQLDKARLRILTDSTEGF